jgi:hypothetical protein
MRPVTRDEVLDYATYNDHRPEFRSVILEAKRVRRICIGGYITLLFENHDTVLYQVQEMMRVERIVRERDIQHEIRTYNELLGGDGEIGATLFIGIDDEAARDVRLKAWLGLLPTIYAEFEDGSRVPPTWDDRQVGTDRLSSVQYIKFDTSGRVPIRFGCSFPDDEIRTHVVLTDEERAALAADLADH